METEIDQGNHCQDADREASENQLQCAESPQEYDSLGDLEILPRIGDEYQVELPPFLTAPGQVSPSNTKIYVNSIDVATHKFLVGLPLSIMWVPSEVTNIKQESAEPSNNSYGEVNKSLPVKSELPQGSKAFSESCEPKVEPMDVATVFGESDKSALQHKRNNYMLQKYGEQRYCPLPCSSGDSWNETEEAAFLLGLYIFGKNLVLVQKFVETKKMGDMLSFYYGKFYRSERYRRWSECRKMRSRKCIYGQRIFTGSRQQELLSRLLHHLSEGRHTALLEVSKAFGEGKILLEEYVFSLKATVGLNSLVNAVSIGKGKEDLTGIALEPPKANHVALGHPEIPVGKACSMLTASEIINFLTGNYRLSKARSNDLFWEAVWPRLLARGWHSEQPKDHVYAVGSKHSLVFLIPGVKKFSRRKLVKGNHYFDSISDVLNRVASDPGLLELEAGGEQNNQQMEGGFADGIQLEKNDSGNQQRPCYLKPRTPTRRVDFMKFTIVDTSLANGQKCKFRELRTLPVETNSTLSHGPTDDSEQESSEASTDKSDSESSLPGNKGGGNCYIPTGINFDSGLPSKRNSSTKMFPLHASSSIEVSAIPENEKTKINRGMLPPKSMKGLPNKRTKIVDKGQVPPAAKRRRRVTACSRTEATRTSTSSNNLVGSEIKQANASGCRDSLLVSALASSKGVLLEQKLSSPSPSCSSYPTSEATLSSTLAVAENTNDEVQPRVLIDLNLPVPLEIENDEHLTMDMIKREHEEMSIEPGDASEQNAIVFMPGPELQPGDAIEMKPSVSISQSEVMPVTNARRQSTRNRPLTTKALEALACGFLSTNQRRKRMDRTPPQKSSKSSRRARGEMGKTDAHVGSTVNIKAEEKGHDGGNCNEVIEQVSNVMQMELSSNLGVSQLVNK